MEQIFAEFFTWGTLATFAGATAATMVLTELLKGVGFVETIPTRVFSYLAALCVLLGATLFGGEVTVSAVLLCLVNAAVVALAAQGGYNVLAGGLSTRKYSDAQEIPPVADEQACVDTQTGCNAQIEADEITSKSKPPEESE